MADLLYEEDISEVIDLQQSLEKELIEDIQEREINDKEQGSERLSPILDKMFDDLMKSKR